MASQEEYHLYRGERQDGDYLGSFFAEPTTALDAARLIVAKHTHEPFNFVRRAGGALRKVEAEIESKLTLGKISAEDGDGHASVLIKGDAKPDPPEFHLYRGERMMDDYAGSFFLEPTTKLDAVRRVIAERTPSPFHFVRRGDGELRRVLENHEPRLTLAQISEEDADGNASVLIKENTGNDATTGSSPASGLTGHGEGYRDGNEDREVRFNAHDSVHAMDEGLPAKTRLSEEAVDPSVTASDTGREEPSPTLLRTPSLELSEHHGVSRGYVRETINMNDGDLDKADEMLSVKSGSRVYVRETININDGDVDKDQVPPPAPPPPPSQTTFIVAMDTNEFLQPINNRMLLQDLGVPCKIFVATTVIQELDKLAKSGVPTTRQLAQTANKAIQTAMTIEAARSWLLYEVDDMKAQAADVSRDDALIASLRAFKEGRLRVHPSDHFFFASQNQHVRTRAIQEGFGAYALLEIRGKIEEHRRIEEVPSPKPFPDAPHPPEHSVLSLPGKDIPETFVSKLWIDRFGLERLRRMVADEHPDLARDEKWTHAVFRAFARTSQPGRRRTAYELELEVPEGFADVLRTASEKAGRMLRDLHQEKLHLRRLPPDWMKQMRRFASTREVFIYSDKRANEDAADRGEKNTWHGAFVGNRTAVHEAIELARELEGKQKQVFLRNEREVAFVCEFEDWLAKHCVGRFGVEMEWMDNRTVSINGAGQACTKAWTWFKDEVAGHVSRGVDIVLDKHKPAVRRGLFMALRKKAKGATHRRTLHTQEEHIDTLLGVHVMAQDDEEQDLAKLVDQAEHDKHAPGRFGTILSMRVDLVAPQSSIHALQQMEQEIKSLAKDYKEDSVRIEAHSVSKIFDDDTQRRGALDELKRKHGLYRATWAPKQRCMYLAGDKDSVQSAKDELLDLDQGAKITTVKVKCPEWFWQAVRSKYYWVTFVDPLRNKLKKIDGLRVNHQSVVPKNEPGVLASLTGNERAIASARPDVESFRENLCAIFAEEVLPAPLDAIHVFNFLTKNNQLMLRQAISDPDDKRCTLGCGFELPGGARPDDDSSTAHGHHQRARTFLRARISSNPPQRRHDGLELVVMRGDLLLTDCDAVVNPANSQLAHGGGAAAHIKKHAGGAKFDAECGRAMRDAGFDPLDGGVSEGRALRTGSCDMMKSHGVKHIIHAVGRSWMVGKDNAIAKKLMRAAVREGLTLATSAGANALAIPLMGSGIWNWPPDEAACEILSAILDWASNTTAHSGSLRRVVLVDREVDAVHAFCAASRNAVTPNDSDASTISPSDDADENASFHSCSSDDDAGPLNSGTYSITYEEQLQWSWHTNTWEEVGKGVPQLYDWEQNETIERAWYAWKRGSGKSFVDIDGDRKGKPSDSKHGNKYQVHFDRMVQVNIDPSSRYERKVFRKAPVQKLKPLEFRTAPSSPAAEPRSPLRPSRAALVKITEDQVGTAPQHTIKLHGKKEHIEAVRERLQRIVEEHMCTSKQCIERCDSSVPMNVIMRCVRSAAKKLEVELLNKDGVADVDEKDGAFKVRALGEVLLSQAEKQLDGEVLKAERAFKESRMRTPEMWEQTDKDCAVFDVAPGSSEWVGVVNNINSFGFDATVTKLERVQHKERWEKYAFQRDLMARSLNPDGSDNIAELANEKCWLMHGTSSADAKAVATSPEGIDPIWGAGWGLFGQGSYFAEDTRYCHEANGGYVSKTPDGEFQVLVVRVLAGKVDELSAPDTKIRAMKAGFHSIRGPVVTGQYWAYIVKEAHRSYPEYIVTYKKE